MRILKEKSIMRDFCSYSRVDVHFMVYTVIKVWCFVFYIYPKSFKRSTGKRFMFRFLS